MSADRVGAGLNTVSTNGGSTITPSTASVKGLVIKQQTAQSGNLLEIDDTANTELVTVRADGSVVVDMSSSTNAALRVTQRGTSAAFIVEDTTTPDSSPFVVDADGRVGIGTTSPISKLHVVAGDTTVDTNSNNEFAFGFQARKDRAGSIVQSGDAVGALSFRGFDGSSYVVSAQIVSSIDGTPGLNDMPGRITFLTTADGASTPSERMRITSNGNIGLGITNPAAKLHIEGDTILRGNTGAKLHLYRISDDNTAFLSTSGSGDITFTAGTASPTERVRITSTGNVGIGTTAPGWQLHIASDSATTSAMVRSSSDAQGAIANFIKQRGSGASPSIVNSGDIIGQLQWWAHDGGQIRIAAGIRSDVDGTPGASDMPGRLVFLTTADGTANLTERMRIDNAGRVGIGAAAGTGFKLDVFDASTATFRLLGNAQTELWMNRASDANVPPRMLFVKARGAVASSTSVAVGDALGDISFFGFDGASNIIGARILAVTDNTTGTNDMPTSLIFSTTADGAATLTERMRIDSAGRVGIGAAASHKLDVFDSTDSRVRIVSNGNAQLNISRYSTDAAAPLFTFEKYRGSTGGVTALTSGDNLGDIQWTAFDGTNGFAGALIRSTVDGAVSTNVVPTRLTFFTTSGNTVTERMRITSAGNVGIGTTNPNQLLHIQSNIIGNARVRTQLASADALGFSLDFMKARGTIASPTIVNNGDATGDIAWWAYDGTNYQAHALIRANVQGTPGTNDMPGSIAFLTSADGSTTLAERLRIFPSGDLRMAQANTRISWSGSLDAHYILFDSTFNGLEVSGFAGLKFSTGNGTERMRLDSDGYLLVNTTARSGGGNARWGRLVSSHNVSNTAALKGVVTNASYADPIFTAESVRTANSVYSYFFALSDVLSANDTEFNLRGDGSAFADGTWSGGGADYAEYFEWADGNPDEEDRRGIVVTLDGDKIVPAESGDPIIGVISGNPSVVGDAAWNKWSGKYLRDDYGTYVFEDYEVWSWESEEEDSEGNTTTKPHSYAFDQIPEDVVVPDEYDVTIQQRRKLNPAYDPEQPYVSREDRPEWDCVGMMGKLRIRKGQPTDPRWIKMRDISANVEEWLVR